MAALPTPYGKVPPPNLKCRRLYSEVDIPLKSRTLSITDSKMVHSEEQFQLQILLHVVVVSEINRIYYKELQFA